MNCSDGVLSQETLNQSQDMRKILEIQYKNIKDPILLVKNKKIEYYNKKLLDVLNLDYASVYMGGTDINFTNSSSNNVSNSLEQIFKQPDQIKLINSEVFNQVQFNYQVYD